MSFISRITLKRTFYTNFHRTLSSASIGSNESSLIICPLHKSQWLQVAARPRRPHTCLLSRPFSDSGLPAHIKVPLPALSPTMELGTIVSWAKKEGDKLNEGDLLAEIETDKATMGFETPEEGYLAKILVEAGSRDVPVGKVVCIITEEESDVAAFKDYKAEEGPVEKPADRPAPPATPTAEPVQPPPPPSPPSEEFASEKGRVYASPMARRLAINKNIRLEALKKGSGLFGSVKAVDVESSAIDLAAAPAAAPPPRPPGAKHTDHPLSNIRAVIAKRLSQSKQTIPHFCLTMDICADSMLQVRTILNKELEGLGVKLSVNDFVVKATAMACLRVPQVNSSWMDSFIREYHTVDVSVAVNTRKGLLTPIIFDADQKKLREISTDMKTLAVKAREGKLQPHEFQGGTISVSNLGMFGITHFSAIINPPQACILSVGGLQDRLVMSKTKPGSVITSKYMTVTLNCDHRVVDGAVGAQWMTHLRTLLESPEEIYNQIE